jgi:polyisoprenoid-binding protein YceI
MRMPFFRLAVAAVFVSLAGSGMSGRAADEYTVDAVHSSVTFKVPHLGISFIHGRFNAVSGNFTIDPDNADKSSFAMTIKTDSVDTNNKGRDAHLCKADFFNATQFPSITFKSTSVKAVKDGYEVKGDLTLHGETKPISFTLKGGKKAQFPPGAQRTGFSTDLTIKRSDFKMDKMLQMIGDEVPVSISFEGVKK